MYFLSRSSRATPKARTARGAVRVDQNGCVLIELDVAAVGTTNFFTRTTTQRTTSPFFTLVFGAASLTLQMMTSPSPARNGARSRPRP